MNPINETKVERDRLFNKVLEEILTEEYNKHARQQIYKIFENFHKEVIHDSIQTKVKEEFAELIKEETDIKEEQIQ